MGNLQLSTTQNLHQSGFSGYGALLTVSRQLDNSFPGTFMGALMGISAVNVRTNVIPSYHMQSKGRFQSFSPGLRDGGEISAAVNWLPGPNDTQGRYADDWSLLRQATLESNDLTSIRVFAPDPDLHMLRVNGFLTQLGPFSYQPEAIMSGQVGWKIVGEPRLTTPLVYEVSGFASSGTGSPTAGTTWDTRSANTANNTVGEYSTSVTAQDVSKAGASESGSRGTGIRVNGSTYRASNLESSNAPDIDVEFTGSTTTDGEAIINVSVSQLPAATQSTSGTLRARLYIAGIYEIWLDPGTTNNLNGARTWTSGTSADVYTFIQRLISNGGKCLLAIYGDDEPL